MGRYSTPIQDLIDRLTYHTATGQTPARMLAGMKIVQVPTVEVEGTTDLPSARIYVPDFIEFFAPARNIDGAVQVKVIIASDRAQGIPAALAWVEKFLDAVQTNTSGDVSALSGTARHFDVNVKDSMPTDRSLDVPLMLTLHLKKNEVGHRA